MNNTVDLKNDFSDKVVVLSEVEAREIVLPPRNADQEPYLVYIARLALDPVIAQDVRDYLDQKLKGLTDDKETPDGKDAPGVYLLKTARAYIKSCIAQHEQKNNGFDPELGIQKWLATRDETGGFQWDINDAMGRAVIPAVHFAYTHATADVEGVKRLSDEALIQKYQMPIPYELPLETVARRAREDREACARQALAYEGFALKGLA